MSRSNILSEKTVDLEKEVEVAVGIVAPLVIKLLSNNMAGIEEKLSHSVFSPLIKKIGCSPESMLKEIETLVTHDAVKEQFTKKNPSAIAIAIQNAIRLWLNSEKDLGDGLIIKNIDLPTVISSMVKLGCEKDAITEFNRTALDLIAAIINKIQEDAQVGDVKAACDLLLSKLVGIKTYKWLLKKTVHSKIDEKWPTESVADAFCQQLYESITRQAYEPLPLSTITQSQQKSAAEPIDEPLPIEVPLVEESAEADQGDGTVVEVQQTQNDATLDITASKPIDGLNSAKENFTACLTAIYHAPAISEAQKTSLKQSVSHLIKEANKQLTKAAVQQQAISELTQKISQKTREQQKLDRTFSERSKKISGLSNQLLDLQQHLSSIQRNKNRAADSLFTSFVQGATRLMQGQVEDDQREEQVSQTIIAIEGNLLALTQQTQQDSQQLESLSRELGLLNSDLEQLTSKHAMSADLNEQCKAINSQELAYQSLVANLCVDSQTADTQQASTAMEQAALGFTDHTTFLVSYLDKVVANSEILLTDREIATSAFSSVEAAAKTVIKRHSELTKHIAILEDQLLTQKAERQLFISNFLEENPIVSSPVIDPAASGSQEATPLQKTKEQLQKINDSVLPACSNIVAKSGEYKTLLAAGSITQYAEFCAQLENHRAKLDDYCRSRTRRQSLLTAINILSGGLLMNHSLKQLKTKINEAQMLSEQLNIISSIMKNSCYTDIEKQLLMLNMMQLVKLGAEEAITDTSKHHSFFARSSKYESIINEIAITTAAPAA